jgi:hypothetical protein
VLGWEVINRASVVVDCFDIGLLGGLFYYGGGGAARSSSERTPWRSHGGVEASCLASLIWKSPQKKKCWISRACLISPLITLSE